MINENRTPIGNIHFEIDRMIKNASEKNIIYTEQTEQEVYQNIVPAKIGLRNKSVATNIADIILAETAVEFDNHKYA